MSHLSLTLWRSAPLDARLRFAAELLPAVDPVHRALKEAIGVVQLWRRGPDLEAWALAYPSLVVDTAGALSTAPTVEDEAHEVAAQLLAETRVLLTQSLQASGFEWINPQPGEPPPADCSCEGDGPVVNACLSPGLRHHGVLLLPAEVRLGSTAAEPNAASEAPQDGPISAARPIAGSVEVPEWLRLLQQSGNPPHPTALETLATATTVDDPLLFAALDGLREALANQDAGPSLRAWLKSEANAEVLEPQEGERFDPLTMQAVSERRTVHEHEADTVARLERVGFMREGRVLAPAEVVRYVAGEAW